MVKKTKTKAPKARRSAKRVRVVVDDLTSRLVKTLMENENSFYKSVAYTRLHNMGYDDEKLKTIIKSLGYKL